MNKEEKCKELLEKVKQTPDSVIEDAIDSLGDKMLKEEIEEIKKLLFQDRLTQYGKRKLVQYLEQKETILDKVTDKLKEDIRKAKEQIKYWEQRYRIAKEEKEEFYIKSYHRQINRWQSRYETLREILNIIEGEKK